MAVIACNDTISDTISGRLEPDPETVAGSQLTDFLSYCRARTGRALADQADLYAFSVAESRSFWSLFLDWSGIVTEGAAEPVRVGDEVETAVFFPGLSLSYVENLLRPGADDDLAIIATHSDRDPDRLTRGRLRTEVWATAAGFAELGVRAGDRVVLLAHNDADTIVAALGALALGATVSAAGPDMGSAAILSRFTQLEPKVLVADRRDGGLVGPSPLAERIREVAAGLPSLTCLVLIDDLPGSDELGVPVHRLSDLRATRADFVPARLPFNHPLFVLFTSGTTGAPKAMEHGSGGTLLEHLKEHRLHGDLGPGDRLFFHTSTAWMMWNWQLTGLACGATIVTYDGVVTGPDTLWGKVAAQDVTVFGTSPPYLQLCEDSRYQPAELGLPALRSVMSTGSILADQQYDWVWREVGPVPVQSISGGSDIIGCFALGSPNLPVVRGELQCLSLGLDVRSLATAGAPGAPGAGIGELVCANPFPSRPVRFVNDPDGRRFHDSYFRQHPGMWTHGDLIELTASGGARMHGRSDGVLNIGGQRVGPAEVYRILRGLPEITEAIAVEQRLDGAASRMVLVVVLAAGVQLDPALAAQIRARLARDGSAAHVPASIVAVDQLPITFSGKRSESAVSRVVNGEPLPNTEALRNPECLAQVVARLHASDVGGDHIEDAGRVSDDQVLKPAEVELRDVWEGVLDVRPIGLDDDFFDLGGTSLSAVRMLLEVRERLGRELTPSVMLHHPTIARLAKLLGKEAPSTGPLIRMKPGTGRPVFLLHGIGGDVLHLRPLVKALRTTRPVYGVRALGLDPRRVALRDVPTIAARFREVIRTLQPEGPYSLAGHSFGGMVAYEMAVQWLAEGECVDFVGLIDSDVDAGCLEPGARMRFYLALPFREVVAGLRRPRESVSNVLVRARQLVRSRLDAVRGRPAVAPSLYDRMTAIHDEAFQSYRPPPYEGTVVMFRASIRQPGRCDPLPVWREVARRGLIVRPVEGGHTSALHPPHVATLAREFDAALESA